MKMYRFKLHQGMHPNPYIQNELFILNDNQLEYQKMPLNEEIVIERFSLETDQAKTLRAAFEHLFEEKDSAQESLMEFMDANFMSLKIIESGKVIHDDTFNFEPLHKQSLTDIYTVLNALKIDEPPLILSIIEEVSS